MNFEVFYIFPDKQLRHLALLCSMHENGYLTRCIRSAASPASVDQLPLVLQVVLVHLLRTRRTHGGVGLSVTLREKTTFLKIFCQE